jgi:pyrroline-5-carboxylate reductase
MKTQTLGFIGAGRVTRILLQAFLNKNFEYSKIVVADTNKSVTDDLKRKYPYIQIEDASGAASQDIVFISLHPPVVMDMLELIKNQIRPGSVIISLAPKITVQKISSKLGNTKNIGRLIPNATSFINEGYNPLCLSPDFGPDEKQQVLKMLSLLGRSFEVSEEKLESYAIMSAMLPTYFWFQWKELMDIGSKMGLNENETSDSIRETTIASLDLMFKSDLKPSEVMDLIPVKPIGEYESQISEIYKTKLLGLYEKIKP